MLGGDFVIKKLVVPRRHVAKRNARHEIKKNFGGKNITSTLESVGEIHIDFFFIKKNPSNLEAIELGSHDTFID